MIHIAWEIPPPKNLLKFFLGIEIWEALVPVFF